MIIEDHEHSFFLGNTKKEFELYDYKKENEALKFGAGLPEQLYVMIEYAWINCKCGEVRRVVVTQGNNSKHL